MKQSSNSSNKSKKNDYQKRRKRMISIVCLILAAIFLLWTVAGTAMFTFAAEKNSVQTRSLDEESEMRGVWVCTVGNIDYPRSPTTSATSLMAQADEILDNCYDMGMNTIFLQVRPASDAFYPSEFYPWSRYLTGVQGQAPSDGFDPLAYWVQGAHDRGLELHAWINPYRITTSGSDWDKLSYNNPAKGAYNDYVVKYDGNYYFDPGSPEVRNLITWSVEEIVRNYDVDGIHFDDYFYPGSTFDDSATYRAYGNGQNKTEWRRENVNMLIRQITKSVHSIDHYCVFGVSPMGIWANKSSSNPLGSATRGAESYNDRYADCYAWVKNNWIDYIMPQIYWNIGYSIADYDILANWWNNVVAGTHVKLYIGMADYRVGTSSWKNGVDGLLDELVLNDSLPNVDGEVHFSYHYIAENSSLVATYKRIYVPFRMPANTDPYGAYHQSGLYDVGDHWAEEYITTLVNAGVINGMGDGTFQPNAQVTRAQFVKMLATAVGAGNFGSLPALTFEDVPEGSWFTDYIKWACNLGVVSGRSSKQFSPDDQITREEMAKMLSNYCNTLSKLEEEDLVSLNFPDKNDISSWALDAVIDVVSRGLMNGSGEDDGRIYFYPSHTATRAEAAKVICVLRDMIG